MKQKLLIFLCALAFLLSAPAADFATAQLTLSTTASQVAALRTRRYSVLVRNLDASISIYVGGLGVTTTTGMLLKAGESITIRTVPTAIYAIASSGTPAVAILEEYE